MNRRALKRLNLGTLLRASSRRNRWPILAGAAILAAACSQGTPSAERALFRGVAVGDEPLAAQAGAEILAQGGSAADAAVAMYFVLSVTYPTAASLGGGGVCLVNDPVNGDVRSLNFLAPRAVSAGSAARATAVPANVRGMAALHARYGDLDWRMLLSPAERIARFGKPLTRASARALETGGGHLLSDGEARRIFAPTGSVPGEGAIVRQTDLANTIAELRLQGASTMYSGDLADRLVRATRRAGGSLAHEDLRNFLPDWQFATGIEFGNDTAYFAPPPAGAGLLAGQMWAMLTERSQYRKASDANRYRMLAETARYAWEGRARWLADDGPSIDAGALIAAAASRAALPDGDGAAGSGAYGYGPPPRARPYAPSGTGFVILDVLGGAVACTFTSYQSFGIGAVAPGTGILLAPAPQPGDRNPVSLGPLLVFNPRILAVKFIAVGGAGPEAASAMMTVAAEAVITGGRLDRAMRRTRTHVGSSGKVYIESSAPAPAREAFARHGDELIEVGSLGRVNAIYCPFGYPAVEEKIVCWSETDSRGFGYVALPN